MKRKNMATMVTCIALVGVVAVGGTLALLSQQSNEVRNTFTVGEGYTANDIILSEADVKQNFDGSYVENPLPTRKDDPVYTLNGKNRYKTNNYSDLVTGTTIFKDPMVTVAANTPDSWVVAHIGTVDSAFAESTFEAANADWYKVTKGVDNKWTVATSPVGTAAEGKPEKIATDTYYIYKQVVTEDDTAQDLTKLFTTLKVNTTVSADDVKNLTSMEVKAGLVQYVEGNSTVGTLTNEELNVIMNAVESKLAVKMQ